MMKKILYFILLFTVPVCVSFVVYLFVYDGSFTNIENQKIKTDTVIEKERINVDSVLFITEAGVELKSFPLITAPTVDLLGKNSIFYVTQRGILNIIEVKGKPIEDFWYEISNDKGVSGWVFGYYTSKSLNRKVLKKTK